MLHGPPIKPIDGTHGSDPYVTKLILAYASYSSVMQSILQVKLMKV
jgi:hypothetical protein